MASRAIFGTKLANQLIEDDVLTPRVRVVDAVVLDGRISDIVYMKRVRQAVEQLSGISKISTSLPISQSVPLKAMK